MDPLIAELTGLLIGFAIGCWIQGTYITPWAQKKQNESNNSLRLTCQTVELLAEQLVEAQTENLTMKRLMESYMNNPGSFDWSVLAELDKKDKEIRRLKVYEAYALYADSTTQQGEHVYSMLEWNIHQKIKEEDQLEKPHED